MIRKYQDAGKIATYSGKSIAQQLLQNTKLGKWLWGDNTYTDGYGTTRNDAPLKESANGQELKRMGETAKGAAELTATGLSFANPVTASKVMAPLIVGSQAYWTGTGFKDGIERSHIMLQDPSQQTIENYVMLGLDFMPVPSVTKQVIRGAKEVVPAAKQLVKEAEAVNYAGRKADNALIKSLFSTSPVVNTVGTFDIVKSQPYARIAPTDLRINTATDYGLRYDPKNYVQLINDTEPGYYSVHFKTDKGSPTSNAVQKVVDKIVSDLPGGSKVATWGSVTKGGFSGLDRFGKAGMIRTGEFRPLSFKDPSVANEVAKKYGLTLNTDGTINLANTQKSTIRLYRAQPVNPTFDSTKAANGEAQREFAGQWFTPDIKKVDWYAHNASTGGVPAELQYVDILEDALPKYAADKHVPKTFDFEPEDYIVPNTIERVTIPYNNTTRISTFDDPSKKLLLKTSNANVTINWPIRRKLYDPQPLSKAELAGLPKVERNQPYKPTTWLQGDDAVNMFRTYGVKEPVVENSPLMEQIWKYVPEARERYGLWGNTNITDDEIAGALYKRAFQLSGENNGAVNAYGEPIILFRGDTQRYPHFKTHNQDGGSPDNRLGTLFLGEYPMDDDGLQRYLGRYYSSASEIGKGGNTKVMNPETSKARSPLEGRIYLDDKVGQMVPLSSGIYKLKGSDMSSGVNDINAFIVRSPSVRDATTEIPVINESLFVEGGIPDSKLYNTRFYYDNGQWHDSKGDIGSNWQAAIREHFDNLLNKVEKSNQGLLVSHPSYIKRWEKWAKKDAVIPSFRDEHSDYNYYVLPDFNRHNAKHLLGYDLNYPLENSWMLYRKQGGKI